MGEIQQPTFTPKEYMQKPKRGEEQLPEEVPYSAKLDLGKEPQAKEKPAPLQISAAPKEGKHGFSGKVRKGSEMTGADKGARIEAVQGGTEISEESRREQNRAAMAERKLQLEAAMVNAAVDIGKKAEGASLSQLKGYMDVLVGEWQNFQHESEDLYEESPDLARVAGEKAKIKEAEVKALESIIKDREEIAGAEAEAKQAANG